MVLEPTILEGFREIKLVRHGESKANTRELVPMQHGDHAIPLTETGMDQARKVGESLCEYIRGKTLVYCSPYLRTRQTLRYLLNGAGVKRAMSEIACEDPRLREVDHGYGTVEDYEKQQALREKHGWFYYRFQGGESPSDCYDRVTTFIDTLWRQAERKNAEKALIVSHGLTIRCFVMRFLHLTVEQFDSMANPKNASVTTLTLSMRDEDHEGAVFRRGRWSVRGIELRKD